MNLNRTKKILSFLKEIDKFKYIERKILLSKRARPETDAEHSWHLAMFVILFEKEFKNLDITKTLKIALTHDLVEIYAGDTYTFDYEGKKSQREREIKAAKKLFTKLPKDLEKEFTNLFLDYEDGLSEEGKLARAFDKIQPILQNIIVNGKNWKKQKISFEDVNNLKRKFMIHDKKILNIYNQLMKEVKEKKLTYEKNRL